jgi:hypothetical protein
MALGLSAGAWSAIASLASTGAGIGTGLARSSQSTAKMPSADPSSLMATGTDYAKMGKAALPGARANAAARGLGSAAPDFMANFVGQQTGEPQAGLSVLEDLRRSGG